MKNWLLPLAFLTLGFPHLLFAQTLQQELAPFPIHPKYLSGLDIPPKKVKAHPERKFFQKRLYKGAELSVFILSSETAENQFDRFPIEEFVYLLNGKADIATSKGKKYSFLARDFIVVPKGFSGKWTNNGGNKYHLELSVISNKRADSVAVSTIEQPLLLDRKLLSGIGLTSQNTGNFSDVLYSGIELDIVTISETSATREVNTTAKEQFIHVLNGAVTITTPHGAVQTFYTGDFFILPKGFSGTWKSEGNNLLRTLRVMQAN